LLEFTIGLVGRTQAAKPQYDSVMAVRNVCAALHFGVRNRGERHYLEGISCCGEQVETMIRASFFNVLEGISNYFKFVNKKELGELLSCLDWSFKARDFENILKLKVFKLLHTGVTEKTQGGDEVGADANIVLKSWQLQPLEPLTQKLQIMSTNLYLSIVSRLTEPEARKIIFGLKEKEATGVASLSRMTSIVNVNAAQALLSEEFNIMFKEFHEFVLVASKIGRYIDFETVSQFYNSQPNETQFFNNKMPQLVSQVMDKIISNARYEDLTVVTDVPDAPEEEVKAEKPRVVKVYDFTKYSPEQIAVLEALDNNQSLTRDQ